MCVRVCMSVYLRACSPTAGCRGGSVGIRFVPDNASGSSQEIHGRGAEINVLPHLHTSRPHGPHILPAVSTQDSIRTCLPSPSFLSHLLTIYLSSPRSSPRSFRWLMYLVDHIIGDPNIGQTYTRSEVRTTTSADKCHVQNANRHFYDVSRRRSFIEAKRPGLLRKKVFSRNPDLSEVSIVHSKNWRYLTKIDRTRAKDERKNFFERRYRSLYKKIIAKCFEWLK